MSHLDTQLQKAQVKQAWEDVRKKRLENDLTEQLNEIQIKKAELDLAQHEQLQEIERRKQLAELAKLEQEANHILLTSKVGASILAVASFIVVTIITIYEKLKAVFGG